MENSPLHAQKVAILSRLIKETSLTLEEALLLLKQEEPATVTIKDGPWGIGTTNPWIQPIGTNSFPLGSAGNPWYGTTTTSGDSLVVKTNENTDLTFSITAGTSAVTTDADLNN